MAFPVGNQLVLPGMLWMWFLLPHESAGVLKYVSVDGWVGVRTKESRKAMEMKAEQGSGICTKDTGERGFLLSISFC